LIEIHLFEIRSLDKTWWGVHQAFKGSEGPLRFLIEGDYGFPGRIDGFVIQNPGFLIAKDMTNGTNLDDY
jgi:hypothetical protein